MTFPVRSLFAVFVLGLPLSSALAQEAAPPTDASASVGEGKESEPPAGSANKDESGSKFADPPEMDKYLRAEGFHFGEETDKASLRVGFLGQVRGLVTDTELTEPSLGAQLRLVRPYLSGHVLDPRFRWMFQAEFAPAANQPNPRLLDAEIGFRMADELAFRVGQFRTPTGRQWMAPLFAMQMAERSFVSDYFRAGRDIGLEINGGFFNNYVSYRAGIFNGEGQNAVQRAGDEYLAAGRLELHPLGRAFVTETPVADGQGDGLIFALLANHQQAHVGGDITQPGYKQTSLGGDITAHFGPMFATAEGYYRTREQEASATLDTGGGFVQAGVFVLPELLEIALRGNYLWQLNASATDNASMDAVVNLYGFGNSLKLQGGYTFGYARSAGASLVPTQALGASNTGLLQVQVFL